MNQRPQWQLWMLVALAVVLLTACAAKELPTGYESLRTEASMVEVSKYIEGLRQQYVVARQQGIIKPEQFVLAVKADQSLTAVWNQFVEARRVNTDTAALWAQVIQASTTLENLLIAWIPNYTPSAPKPGMLGR